MLCYIVAAFQTAPRPPETPPISPERMWRTPETKTPADPVAFLLAALVSNHLQLPRTRRTSNVLSATTSTKQRARRPDPKAALLTSDSTTAGLPLRCLLPKTPPWPQGAARDSEVPFCPSAGDQARSSIRKPGSSLITTLIHC